jgi:hypothetical protein
LLRGGVPAAAVVWCVVLAVLAAIAAYSSGGYFPKDYLAHGAAACVAAGVNLATGREADYRRLVFRDACAR